MSESLFGEDPRLSTQDETLIGVYERIGRTLDDLPYTQEFEELRAAIDADMTRRDVLHRLMNLRKAGKLPRLGKSPSLAVKLTDNEERSLIELLREHLGTTGARDRLPYTEAFDPFHASFTEKTGRQLEQHTLWRLICKLAK